MASRPVHGDGSLAAAGPLSHALVLAAKQHRTRAAELLRPLGLHPGQELLLAQLCGVRERSQGDLVNALGVDASTVARTVARLADQDLIVVRPSPADRRARLVSLTPRGRKLCREIRQVWLELEKATTHALRAEEAQKLRRSLETLAANLDPDPKAS